MTQRVLIVDDEPPARASLRVLLARDPQVVLVGECGSGAEAIAAIRARRPDLLFLDVQMPEVDGFDVLEQLGADTPPAIVFVTAYDQHALRAFDAGALDYLLKPFTDERFALALARAKERAARAAPNAVPDRVVVKSGRQLHVLALADIDWIESADYCVDLHVGARTHSLRRSMAAVESELQPAGFCRIHRTAIVNLARVHSLSAAPDGELEVVLMDGVRLPTSRRHRAGLEARLRAKLV
jgi:two-component system LytT family response regulator